MIGPEKRCVTVELKLAPSGSLKGGMRGRASTSNCGTLEAGWRGLWGAVLELLPFVHSALEFRPGSARHWLAHDQHPCWNVARGGPSCFQSGISRFTLRGRNVKERSGSGDKCISFAFRWLATGRFLPAGRNGKPGRREIALEWSASL